MASYERHLASAESTPEAPAPSADTPTNQDAPTDTRGKEASNLLVLLSELFNFGVISHVLVYDLIRNLLGGALTELRVELLLKLARDGPWNECGERAASRCLTAGGSLIDISVVSGN